MVPNPGARRCLLLCKAQRRHWEGTSSLHEEGTQAIRLERGDSGQSTLPPFSQPEGTAPSSTLSVQTLLKHVVVPV